MEQLSDKKLFAEFPPVSTTDLEEKIMQDLKGADYNKKLVWQTPEGLNVKPYYRAEDLKHLKYLQTIPGEFPFIRTGKTNLNEWEIRQDIIVNNIESANKYVLHILERRVTSPGFKINSTIIGSEKKLSQLLGGMRIDCISLNLLAGKDSPKIVNFLVRLAKNKQLKADELTGSFDFDPLGHLSTTGNFYSGETEDFETLKTLINQAARSLPLYKIINVNGLNFSNAGSSIVQELAFSLSAGNEYLSKLTETGIKIDEIANRMQFCFGIGSNYFLEIAKLRAARLLWAKIVEAYNPDDKKHAKMYLHAVTAGWNKTLFDPYVNMLRSTTEAMSASLGGADSLEVTPFDSAFTSASGFSSHIARNTQIILKEEAYFNKVIDPSAGSYYVENLTDSIAEFAWKLFLEIEEKGGYIEAFKTGIIQKMIAETVDHRLQNIATRKEVLLGTNQYPHFNEIMGNKIDSKVYYQQEVNADTVIAEPLIQIRGSQEFEKLRLQTEKTKKRPKVFLLTIGNTAMRKARAAFSCNFFACAGYEIINNYGFQTVKEGMKAAFTTKADIVVLCSSDDEYSVFAPQANDLKQDTILVIAGEPACKPELERKGIKNYVSMKSNMIEVLRYYHKLLGIEKK